MNFNSLPISNRPVAPSTEIIKYSYTPAGVVMLNYEQLIAAIVVKK